MITWPWQRERQAAALIAATLSPACGICAAPRGCPCDPWHVPAAEYIRIQRDPEPVAAHTDRVLAAIAARAVRRDTVLAQFEKDTAPASLTYAPGAEPAASPPPAPAPAPKRDGRASSSARACRHPQRAGSCRDCPVRK